MPEGLRKQVSQTLLSFPSQNVIFLHVSVIARFSPEYVEFLQFSLLSPAWWHRAQASLASSHLPSGSCAAVSWSSRNRNLSLPFYFKTHDDFPLLLDKLKQNR